MYSRWRIPKNKNPQSSPGAAAPAPKSPTAVPNSSGPGTPEQVLGLQKAAGNQAVSQMIQASQGSHSDNHGVVQREPDDDPLRRYGHSGSNYGKEHAPAANPDIYGSHYGSNYGKEQAPAANPDIYGSHYGSNYGNEQAPVADPNVYGSNYGQEHAPAANPNVYGSNYGNEQAAAPGAHPGAPAPAAPKPSGKFNRAEWQKNLPGKDSLAVKLSKSERYGKQLRPAPLKLPEKFKDENKKVGWRAYQGEQENESAEMKARRARSAETDKRITRHYTPAEQEQNSLRPGTSDRGPTEYAMNPKNKIVMSDGQQRIDRGNGKDSALHHSSMFAGGDVAHAGHIGVNDGKVNYLDDDSGHYRPSAAHTYDAYNRMKSQGLLSKKGSVGMVDKTKQKGVDADYDSAKLNLPFSAYEQTHGNEEQARKKKAMLQELMAVKK